MTVSHRACPALSLDCLTLTETLPADLIRAAAGAGFDQVSLWINPVAAYPRQVVTPDMTSQIAELLDETGIRLGQVEAFDLVSREQVEGLRPCLMLGAALGGRTVQVYNGANGDRRQVAELLRRIVGIAGELGLAVNLEPVSMGRTRTLAQAQRLIESANVDVGVVLDTLHHLRTGGTAADIGRAPPGLIRYVQVNDGILALPPEQWLTEAMAERLYPGEGDFPLREILALAPRDVTWAIEVPQLRRHRAGWAIREQAERAMVGLRSILAPA